MRSGVRVNAGSLVLFFLAIDADLGPGNGLQANRSDLLFAIDANSESTGFYPLNSILDGPQQLCIGLFEVYVDLLLVRRRGTVCEVSVTIGARAARQRAGTNRFFELGFLTQEGFLVLI